MIKILLPFALILTALGVVLAVVAYRYFKRKFLAFLDDISLDF